MDEKQIDALFETRREYREDCQREKFHLDAYAGTGGFSGAIKATASSYWGWAADAYSDSTWALGVTRNTLSCDTYLDRFDREDGSKFEQRRRVVHYENHVEPCVDIPLSYLRRKPLSREGVSPALGEWMKDATGDGTSWDELVMGDVLLRGTVTGMCPVMFDLPVATAADGATRTRADDIAEGRRVRAIPLFGLNLLDYGEDDRGGMEWAKVRFDYFDRDGPLGDAMHRIEIRVMFPDRIDLYSFVEANGKRELSKPIEVFANPFGVVPLAIFRPKPMPGDPVRGIAMIQNIASEARRLFNLHSELDEHIRKSVFAFLQVPSKNAAQAGRVVVGNASALSIDPESKQPYAWISPSQDVSTVIERRVENTVAAIYAMARLAFVRGQIVSAAASGISRQYEFESTNRSVSDIAKKLAEFDQRALRIVSSVEGMGGEEQVHTTPADDFGIEDLDRDLATAETAARGRLGATLLALLRKRLAGKLAPNTPPEIMQVIEAEIAQLAESESRAQSQTDVLADLGGAFPAENGRGADADLGSGGVGDGLDPAVDTSTVDAEAAAAADVESGTVAVSGLAKDPSKALNGAQIDSLLKIVEQVTSGALPNASAVAIILAAFPLTEDDAKAILDPIAAERAKKKPSPATNTAPATALPPDVTRFNAAE